MDWVIKAANEENAERHRREAIARGAPTRWENVCRMIEQVLRTYRQTLKPLPVEFSGRANHTVWVATFAEDGTRPHGPERERVTITFNQELNVIEVRSSRSEVVRTFPMELNTSGQVVLMDGDTEISAEQFTEITLKPMLFPLLFPT